MENCIFCKIARGEIASLKIYEDDMVFAFLDINPVNLGHTLIIPKEHHENILDLPEEIAAHVIKIGKRISTALKKKADGINIIMNNGKAAGQVIFHSHMHIIPRYDGDNLAPWPSKKVSNDELNKAALEITQAL